MILLYVCLLASAFGLDDIQQPSSVLPRKSLKLSYEENKQLQANCGKHEQYASSDGRDALEGEIPSAVFLSHLQRKDANADEWTRSISGCSGTLISSRHVLVPAHCLLDTLECFPNKTHAFHDSLEHMTVKVGTVCHPTSGVPCNDSPEEYVIAKVIERFTNMEFVDFKCAFDNQHTSDVGYTDKSADIAIITLDQDIPEDMAVPACVPSPRHGRRNTLTFAGYGVVNTDSRTYRVQMTDMQPTDCAAYGELYSGLRDTFCTKPVPSTVCNGDFGGSLLQKDKYGRHHVFGIGSLSKCGLFEAYESLHVDVRAYSDWICQHTGVCPPLYRRESIAPLKTDLTHSEEQFESSGEADDEIQQD